MHHTAHYPSISDRFRIRALSAAFGMGTALLIGAAFTMPATAQTFPTKPLRIIVPYQAAGAVDFAPRMLAERMAADLGQPVLLENKTGGLGIPAMNDILNGAPDGHLIFAADASHWGINPALGTVTYDFLKDFQPLSLTFTNGLVWVTAMPGINSMQDLIAAARANPGKLNYGSPGIGSVHHLGTEMFRAGLNLDVKHVPYRGAAEMTESILRGDTAFMMISKNSVEPHVKAGKMRWLAVTIATRLKQLPDVPTTAEVTSLKDFNLPGQQGFVVKAGTPRPIVDRLVASMRKGALQPDLYAKVLEVAASEMTPNTPEQFTDLIRADFKKFATAVKISGAKAN